MLKVKQAPTELSSSTSHLKRISKSKINEKFSYLKENSNTENIDLSQCLSSSKQIVERTSKITKTVKKQSKPQKEESLPAENALEKQKDSIDYGLIFQKMSEYFMTIYNPGQILFREEEINQIKEFLNDCFAMKSKQRNLLVTGKPGCGKTLSVNKIIEGLVQNHEDTLFIKVNAMAFKNSQSLFEAIISKVQEKKPQKSKNKENLNEILKKQKTYAQIVLMIDEIDSFFGKSLQSNQDILEIFQVANDLENKICVIGISNSMELLYKIGKKHNANLEDIKNVVFKSYSFPQIMKIIEERIEDFMGKHDLLSKIDTRQILEENALKLCTLRIFNLKGGDIRCVLEVLMKTMSKQYEKFTNDKKNEIKAITLSDLLNVMEEIYNERKIGEIINSLPVIQQAMLLIFYKTFVNSPEKNEIELNKSLCLFNNLAMDFGIPRYNVISFIQGLKLLESYDLIEIKQGSKLKNSNTGENAIIKLQINVDEIKNILVSNETFQKYFE